MRLDLTNKKFGHLTYLKPTGERKRGSLVWLCVCDCGNKTQCIAGDRKKVKSCSKTCILRSKKALFDKTGIFECKIHGLTKPCKAGRTGLTCYECRKNYEKQKFADFKQKLVNIAGGKCVRCGYSEFISALDFHHIRPDDKLFTLTSNISRPWGETMNELKKCVLLCSNCHRGLHSSNWELDESTIS